MSSTSDSRSLAAALGPDSPAVSRAIQNLESIYDETRTMGPVDNSYRAWSSCRPLFGDDSPKAFVRQSCLSLLCRLLAYRYLEQRPSDRDLWNVISGDYFAGVGLGNFLGEDFFSWPFFRLSMGIDTDAESMETARALLSALESLGLDRLSPAFMSDLYREFEGTSNGTGSEVPLSEIAENPRLSCISPYCGDGHSLAGAVQTAVEGQLEEGDFPPDVLLGISEQFLAMTADPMEAVVASVSFVLGMGEEIMEPHPPVLVPVYLAHSSMVPLEKAGAGGDTVYVVEAAGNLELPERVAADPLYLDWLFGRFPNYQRGAALRLRAQTEEVALQEVLNAWYNYLTSPKARTPIPEPLTSREADVMVEAARTLIQDYVRGSGAGPLHLVRNAPAPLFASRRQFDITL